MAARLEQAFDHHRSNRHGEAEKIYREILAETPDNPDAMHFLGLAVWETTEDLVETLRLLEQSMRLAPGQAHMHHNLGTVLGSVGRFDEAIANYKTAIALKPDYAEAYFNLSGVYTFPSDDPLIKGMRSLYAANKLGELDHEFLCYALSKASNDIGHYDDAMHFALEGARLKAPTWDPAKFGRAIGEAKAKVTKQLLTPRQGRGHSTDAPIFIVGMPRSGTTLVEHILSRHPDVLACGELPMVAAISNQMRELARQRLNYKGENHGFLSLIPDEHFANAAGACLSMIDAKANGQSYTRFTDKMPRNVFFLGIIAMMFPNARIIHVRRHPLDCCVSCFFQRFRSGHAYTYRLEWLGHMYRKYVDIMDHWRSVLPLRILDVHYENLVSEPEASTRELIRFAGLEWHDDCLGEGPPERAIQTASRWQVRQPIYTSSLERWRRYETWLEPLIAALGGIDWIKTHAKGRRTP
jgi:tetratricopeptide (TPR) repeat protein